MSYITRGKRQSIAQKKNEEERYYGPLTWDSLENSNLLGNGEENSSFGLFTACRCHLKDV